jgi:hypothetical protein
VNTVCHIKTFDGAEPCANFVPERNLVEQKINELRALV